MLESIWNSLCRQRRTIQWVLIAVLLTSWHHRSQARGTLNRRVPLLAALPNALLRLLPAPPPTVEQESYVHNKNNESITTTTTTTTVCANHGAGTIFDVKRGGYRDDNKSIGTIAVDAPILRQPSPPQQQTQQKKPTSSTSTDKENKKNKKKSEETFELQPSYVFSLFQNGDGHETDVDGIPVRYLNMHRGNRLQAKESLTATLSWRTEHQIDTLLQRPHELYDICKTVFPHYFAGRDTDAHVVFVQRPGLLSVDLARANGLTNEELLQHYVFVNEYLWQIVERESPLSTILGIIDLQGVNLKTIRQSDIISFLKIFVKTMDSHYPQRAHKTLLVNTPKWFGLVYKLVSPLMRESTKEKIELLSRGKKQDAALFARLGGEAAALATLPESFFSKYNHHHNHHKKKNKKHKHHHHRHHKPEHQHHHSDDEGTGDDDDDEAIVVDPSTLLQSQQQQQPSELELELRQFVLDRLQDAGRSMKPVVPVVSSSKN